MLKAVILFALVANPTFAAVWFDGTYTYDATSAKPAFTLGPGEANVGSLSSHV